jgi:SPP1 family predicted phage head-tail adaptor
MGGDPGKKNRLITLKSVTETNTSGSLDKTYATVARVWADFRPLRMDERNQSAAKHSLRTGNFRIYWRDDITPTMVIVWDNQTWRITGIAEVGYQDELDVTAEVVY